MMMKLKTKINPVAAALIIFALCALAGILYINNALKPADPENTASVIVTVPQGAGTELIGNLLKKNGVISSAGVFRLWSKVNGHDGVYRAGSYELSPSMSMDTIIEKIISGDARARRFTIPEGYTLTQIRDRLAGNGLVDGDRFMDEAENGSFDYAFTAGLPRGYNRLEGYLYPETYDIYADESAHGVIDRMLAQFEKLFTEEHYARAEEMGLTAHEIVVIASIIERETAVEEERSLVSSVIHNRLALGMPLQIDATVQYALGEQKSRLAYSDLEINSPYNTYKTKGLPPGPICSPRIECIDAALNPTDTDYIYYVLKPGGGSVHNFTSDYNEFLRYKEQYLDAL
jgi:UPF0755 protein